MAELKTLEPINKDDKHLDAYYKRITYVNNALVNLGNSFKEKGFTVLVPKNGIIKFIYITKDDKHCFVGWTEVPYRWYVNISWEPSAERGSGTTVKEKYNTPTFEEPTCPFTEEEIISYLAPNPRRKVTYLEEL